VQFSVRTGPRHGRLSVVGGGDGTVTTFSQDDVDNGRVSYRHIDHGQSVDSVSLDVTCGTQRHSGLEFGVDVLPATVPLEVTGNLTVPHAGSATLTAKLLKVAVQQSEVRGHFSVSSKFQNCVHSTADFIHDITVC